MTDKAAEFTPENTSPPPAQIREARFDLAQDVILSKKTRLQLDECLARLRFHSAFCKVVVASAVFLSCYFHCRLLPLWVECDGADRLPISRCT